MRFLSHYLSVVMAAAPGLARAQAAPPADSIGCATVFNGYVKAGANPVAGASVGVRGTNIMVVTNGVGFFVLPATVRNRPTLSVSVMGYASDAGLQAGLAGVGPG